MATVKELQQVTEESTSRYVQAGPVRIHYNEVGTGDPILCIHGGGPGATSWSNFTICFQLCMPPQQISPSAARRSPYSSAMPHASRKVSAIALEFDSGSPLAHVPGSTAESIRTTP